MPKLLDAVRAVLLVPGLLVLLLCTAGGARAQDGVATDRAALQALYDAANGAAWTDATSWSSGEPLASWHGVTTDGDGRVTRLELGDNGLSGTLPPALGHLARLEALLLDGNVHLAGPLPAGLRELPALATVDLTGTELCAPQDTAFQDWTATISFSGLICPPAIADGHRRGRLLHAGRPGRRRRHRRDRGRDRPHGRGDQPGLPGGRGEPAGRARSGRGGAVRGVERDVELGVEPAERSRSSPRSLGRPPRRGPRHPRPGCRGHRRAVSYRLRRLCLRADAVERLRGQCVCRLGPFQRFQHICP